MIIMVVCHLAKIRGIESCEMCYTKLVCEMLELMEANAEKIKELVRQTYENKS